MPYGFHSIVIVTFILTNLIFIVQSQAVWTPKLQNEEKTDDPFDYVAQKFLPDLTTEGIYDWGAVSGVSLQDGSFSYVVFGGSQPNTNEDFTSIYRKKSGIVVLCKNKKGGVQSGFKFKLNCDIVKKANHIDSKFKYLGATVSSVNYEGDSAILIYCDPLWFSKSVPQGKCELIKMQNNIRTSLKDFAVCMKARPCVGGFSVDMIRLGGDINILFGYPFVNTSSFLSRATKSKMSTALENTGDHYNYGFSVAFSGDGTKYVSSPVPGPSPPFVVVDNKLRFELNQKTDDKYSGFGTSLDTVHLGDSKYGAVIGAPYYSRKGSENVGAVFLACKGRPMAVVYGEVENGYFGYAVSRLGDVNSDGTEDFAVSAPSISTTATGSGRIFVFATTPLCEIQPRPLQVLSGGPESPPGFGVALSRGLDLDFNGSPDFFVTSLKSTRPHLYSMPPKVQLFCKFTEMSSTNIYRTGNDVTITVGLTTSTPSMDLESYKFQIQLDSSLPATADSRFQLKNLKFLKSNQLKINIKLLQDAVEMDLKNTPFEVKLRAVRPCVVEGNCNETGGNQARLLLARNCGPKRLALAQNVCPGVPCKSDMRLKLKPDPAGRLIQYGRASTYQRKLELIISNLGDNVSPRVYLAAKVRAPDRQLSIQTEVKSDRRVEYQDGQQALRVVIVDAIEKRELNTDDVKVIMTLVYHADLASIGSMADSIGVDFHLYGLNDDPDLSNNNASIEYQVRLEPRLSISGQKMKRDVIPDPRKRPPYISKDGKVQVHELGTELLFSYLVENINGSVLKNVTFHLAVPVRSTARFPSTSSNSDDTSSLGYQPLLYIMDKIRLADGSSFNWIPTEPGFSRQGNLVKPKCTYDPPDLINPLKLIAVETHEHKGATTENSAGYRRKREAQTPSPQPATKKDLTGMNSGSPAVDNSVPIKCGTVAKKIGLPVCAQITCTLDEIPKNSVFNFNFRAWLYTKTFFDNGLSDIKVTVSLRSDLGSLPVGLKVLNSQTGVGPVELTQKVFYSEIKVSEELHVPLWSIILAVVIGIFILVVIILIAYYCGFFKRKRLRSEERNACKASADSSAAGTNGANPNSESAPLTTA